VDPSGRGCSCQCSGGREGVDVEEVDDGQVSNGDAFVHGQEDVPSGPQVAGGGGGGRARVWRQCPPEAQHGAKPLSGYCRGLCRQDRAPDAVHDQGGHAAASYVRGIGGKHGEAEAVLENGVELPAFELEGSGERERIQPDGRGGKAQLRSRAQARWPSSVLWGKEACKVSVWAWAECRESARCAFAMTPMVSGLASRASGSRGQQRCCAGSPTVAEAAR
jgi:hypothetical protein